ncbi:MAG TPA: hypothetical protein VEI97_07520 [bacterium]|nr:hypothetical protein [bacterium]
MSPASRLDRYASQARGQLAQAREILARCATSAEGRRTAYKLPAAKVLRLVKRLSREYYQAGDR